MANATGLSIGGVSVSTSGGTTGNLLANLASAFQNAQQVTVAAGAPLPSAPAAVNGVLPALVIPAGDTGAVSIPAGYGLVVYTGTGTLTGGSPGLAIAGSGFTLGAPGAPIAAGTVIGTGGSVSVADSTAGAMMSFSGGTAVVDGSGAGDTINIGDDETAQVTLSGSGSTITLGNNSSVTAASSAFAAAATTASVNTVIITGTNETTNIQGSSNLVFLTGTDTINASGGDATVVTGQGGKVTLNATGGSQVIYDNIGGNVINGGPATEFVGATGGASNLFTDTVGGADTVFAVSSINYQGAGAASSFFLGGTGVATVLAGTNATLFGGTGGGTYTEGAASTGSFFFWGGGASDTILGGAGSSNVTVWGNNNENTTVSQLGAATGGIYVAYGESDTLNAMNASGGNSFIVVDETLPGGTNFAGNTTLVGSNAGNDTFAFFAETTTTAHTITIENWQASDTLYLGGFSAAQSAAATAALKAAGGSNATITLSDNTTIKFIGTSPTSHA